MSGRSLIEELKFLLDLPFWLVGGFSLGFFGLERELIIAVRSVR